METKNRAGHRKSRAPGGTRDRLTTGVAHHHSELPSGSNITTAQSNNATASVDDLIARIEELKQSKADVFERKRFSWLSPAAAEQFAADSRAFGLLPPPPVDQVETFFASLAWTTRTEWVGVDYDIEPTTELIVHPSVRNGDDIGVVLRGEGWRCTRNGGCGYEDLSGLRMRPSVVEIVDLAATVAKLSTGTS